MLLAVVLTACTTPAGDEPDGKPRRDLAATPQSLPPQPSGSASATARPSGSASGTPSPGSTGAAASTAPTRPGASGTVAPTAGPTSGAPAAPFHEVATRSDRQRDAGAAVAPYADLVSVAIEDNGTDARVTIRVAGAFPSRMPADETLGIGVDFFRSRTQLESDYQLFVDGQPDGWFAYLHTPRGFVKYPGTFGIGGDRMVFTVPWSSLGSPQSGAFAGFADWSRVATPANVYGEDHAPDLGNAGYAR